MDCSSCKDANHIFIGSDYTGIIYCNNKDSIYFKKRVDSLDKESSDCNVYQKKINPVNMETLNSLLSDIEPEPTLEDKDIEYEP